MKRPQVLCCAVLVVLTAQLSKAATIAFNDLTDTIVVTAVNNAGLDLVKTTFNKSACSVGKVNEVATCNLMQLDLPEIDFSTSYDAFATLTEPGGLVISDFVHVVLTKQDQNGQGGLLNVAFFSDSFGSQKVPPLTDLSLDEKGTSQVLDGVFFRLVTVGGKEIGQPVPALGGLSISVTSDIETPEPAPEPDSLVLVSLGVLLTGLAVRARSKNRAGTAH